MAKVSLRAYNREIETMIDRGQLDEAIANCHHIFKTYPKHLETYRLLGKAYLEYKRFKEAVDVFSRVLVSEPNDFVANVGMSIIRDDENKLDDAIWHMERAFETQPSNSAIQGELQRLYGRRDGVQPPRIRMTRGALAHMYVQGELYPQAISEIKSVLKEDPGRSDMEALLARACYRSGLKNEAADAASKVLRRYPYCLDANRVLMEILGADHPENAQIYRQRVIELDPYAAQVTGSVFQSNEVQDAAVSLEHLDWNGQPSASQADWSASQGISLESGEQPDWLKNNYVDTIPPTSPSPTRPLDQTQGGPAPASAAVPSSKTGEEIPDFLRAAGWGQSTGAFDESKSIFGDEQSSAAAAQPIEQGEMPDWVKAMAPTEATTPAEEETLPDWINKIGTGALPVPSASEADSQLDWMSQLGQTSETPSSAPQTADNDLDWLSQLGQPAESASSTPSIELGSFEQTSDASEVPQDPLAWTQPIGQAASSEALPASEDLPAWITQPGQPAPMEQSNEDQPDWMKQFDQPVSSATSDLLESINQTSQPAQSESIEQSFEDQPDSMKQRNDQPAASATTDLPDWMTQPSEPAESFQPAATQQASEDQPDWMKQFDQPSTSASADLPDWMIQPSEPAESFQPAAMEQSIDDQPDWMRPLDTHEDLPASMEQPSHEQPAVTPISSDFDFLNELTEENQPETSASSVPASMQDTGNLGVSEQERDDSFAWLENLAAKQGATEGLLTKPEDRLQEEPDWVKQAKGLSADQPAAESSTSSTSSTPAESEPEIQTPVEPTLIPFEAPAAMQESPKVEPPTLVQQPTGSIEELGKSDQERDDSFAWLENLAAKQGASEGLLTKPEDRLEQEPEWVRQAKDLNMAAGEPPAPSIPAPIEPPAITPPAPMEDVPPAFEQPSTSSSISSPVVNREELGKSEQERDDSFAWLENLAAKQGASEGLLTKPEDRLEEEPEWVRQAKDLAAFTPSTPSTPVTQEPIQEVSPQEPALDNTAAWLRSLDDEESKPVPAAESSKDDTAIWLKNLDEEESKPASVAESSKDDIAIWLKNLDEEESKLAPASEVESSKDDTAMWFKNLSEEEAKPVASTEPAIDETAMWLKSLDEAEKPVAQPEASEASETSEPSDLPAWMQNIDEETSPAAESTVPDASREASEASGWPGSLAESAPTSSAPDAPKRETGSLPSWLRGLENTESRAQQSASASQDDLPAWLRDETGEVVAEPTRIEPTRPTDWRPAQTAETSPPEPPATEPASVEAGADWQAVEEKQPEAPESVAQEPEPLSEAAPVDSFEIVRESVRLVEESAPEPELTPAPLPPQYKEPIPPRKGTGMLTMPLDPILGSARNELSRSNIPAALDTYAKLIKKGRFLDEVIHDLREALYRYPVEVNIWQSLGDAYMRSNRLQDALDAYTKAEELLR